ncbi:MAG: cytochrome c3 family protein [Gemmatimonadales bacterium]|nr:cytochrome c3 family protein [Gemmatimonadales bacterium]
MKRTTAIIAGGTLLGIGAALAGVSMAGGQGSQQTATPAPGWSFPLLPTHGSGYSSLDSAQPGGPWPTLPGRLRGPEQPLFYRHDVHAGQYRIPCLYCHNNAANSWTANIPTVSTCMGCHLVMSAPDTAGNPNADIAKLRDFAGRGEPIPWVRVNKIAEHAHFPHMRHVNAGLACQSCHGNIQQMPRVFAAQNVNQMGWCTNCHMRRGITRDCTTCHF